MTYLVEFCTPNDYLIEAVVKMPLPIKRRLRLNKLVVCHGCTGKCFMCESKGLKINSIQKIDSVNEINRHIFEEFFERLTRTPISIYKAKLEILENIKKSGVPVELIKSYVEKRRLNQIESQKSDHVFSVLDDHFECFLDYINSIQADPIQVSDAISITKLNGESCDIVCSNQSNEPITTQTAIIRLIQTRWFSNYWIWLLNRIKNRHMEEIFDALGVDYLEKECQQRITEYIVQRFALWRTF